MIRMAATAMCRRWSCSAASRGIPIRRSLHLATLQVENRRINYNRSIPYLVQYRRIQTSHLVRRFRQVQTWSIEGGGATQMKNSTVPGGIPHSAPHDKHQPDQK